MGLRLHSRNTFSKRLKLVLKIPLHFHVTETTWLHHLTGHVYIFQNEYLHHKRTYPGYNWHNFLIGPISHNWATISATLVDNFNVIFAFIARAMWLHSSPQQDVGKEEVTQCFLGNVDNHRPLVDRTAWSTTATSGVNWHKRQSQGRIYVCGEEGCGHPSLQGRIQNLRGIWCTSFVKTKINDVKPRINQFEPNNLNHMTMHRRRSHWGRST